MPDRGHLHSVSAASAPSSHVVRYRPAYADEDAGSGLLVWYPAFGTGYADLKYGRLSRLMQGHDICNRIDPSRGARDELHSCIPALLAPLSNRSILSGRYILSSAGPTALAMSSIAMRPKIAWGSR